MSLLIMSHASPTLYRALNYIEPCATPPSPLLSTLTPSTIPTTITSAGRGFGRREEDDAQNCFALGVRAEVHI